MKSSESVSKHKVRAGEFLRDPRKGPPHNSG
jgi:hypothetical protein